MKEIWGHLRLAQKGTLVAVPLVLALGIGVFAYFREGYVPLFPAGKVVGEEVHAFLEEAEVSFRQRRDGTVLVPKGVASEIRSELALAGIPKAEATKGFELFDSNTWIKGDKELQVLEMRALKGQLERDLTEFEHIKSARVILDMPPAKTFGVAHKPKASVIVGLKPGASLSHSELRAVVNHLGGAVRGLEPQMIAVSDTRGKVYKELDPDGNQEESPLVEVEDGVREKLDAFLAKVVGANRFHTSVQVTPEGVTAAVAFDKEIAEMEELRRQLYTILEGVAPVVTLNVDRLPFERKWKVKKEKVHLSGILFSTSLLVGGILLVRRLLRRAKPLGDDPVRGVMTRVNLKHLAASIREEDPETIALMLSYLEPKRAEALLAKLPEEVQHAVSGVQDGK